MQILPSGAKIAPQKLLTADILKEFQLVVVDQRAAQELLAAALDILKGFYEWRDDAAANIQFEIKTTNMNSLTQAVSSRFHHF